ncbi:MAG: methyltransferase domain-containing protein [Pseudomonadota bacterium]|nr:methyltransferase domain-containing protein [Pseudomonadota bacterium]
MKPEADHKSPFTPEAYAEMTAWFDSPLGQHLLTAERRLIDQMLARRFGYHLLQLGCADLQLHDKSPMGHKFSFRPWPCKEQGKGAGAGAGKEGTAGHAAIADMEAIPLASESVDLVLLHHALDFSPYQHQLLREAERVLIAGGHLVIVGFNPMSSWGLRRRLQLFRRKAPWHASMLGTARLIDWLKLLDFQVEQLRYGMYSLPVNSESVIRYSGLLDPVAAHLNWPTGGVYAISARKQVLPLTLVQTKWRTTMPVPGLGLPMPDKVGQVARNRVIASNEDRMS